MLRFNGEAALSYEQPNPQIENRITEHRRTNIPVLTRLVLQFVTKVYQAHFWIYVEVLKFNHKEINKWHQNTNL